MAKVSINKTAPDFVLDDYKGIQVSLSQFKGDQHVLLVLNRGFV